MKELGGMIKIAEVFSVLSDKATEKDLQKNIFKFLQKKGGLDRKVFFGLSFYNQEKIKINNKNFGLEIKKQLAEVKISSRLVTSREEILSAVTVKMNKLLSARGAEIIVASTAEETWLANTLTVQPFDEFSQRDFGRPGRDSFSGMLPPKLAKIMINLATNNYNDIILDPFCGSGTILTEAYLMGYQNIFGSDNSPKAISDTEKNLAWSNTPAEVRLCDATKLSDCYSPNFFNTIVTEPYLGPPQRGHETPEQILQAVTDLRKLYLDSLKEITKVLKKGGTVLMVWPIIHDQKMALEKNLNSLGLKIQTLLPQTEWFEEQTTLVYARPDQIVKREIVKITKTAQ
ncbi:MAG: DNA methyltransferase [Candidatus Magasanikbacteria bacterium]|nr:DNA methyltransferase [Candidatus Magasanikbacteria bacterium]